MKILKLSNNENVGRYLVPTMAILWAACCTIPSEAAYLVNYLPDAGSTFLVPGIEPNATGATMEGARVQVFYNSGPSALLPTETVFLQKTGVVRGTAEGGVGFGMAGGPLWTLNLNGDSATADWALNGFAGDGSIDPDAPQWGINKMVIELPPGNAVWDRDAPVNTVNSVGGITFNFGNPSLPNPPNLGAWNVDVRYVNPVALNSSPSPLGDVFSVMEIDFTSPFDVNDRLVFRADTDELVQVPEPSTACYAIGLVLGVMLLRRWTSD